MKIINPNYITIFVHFTTESIIKDNITNDFRRSFVNLEGRGSPKIRIEADNKYKEIIDEKGEEFPKLKGVLIPFNFSIIKERIEERRPAVGVIMIYKYLGVPQYLEDLLKKLHDFISERSKSGIFSRCKKYEILVSKEI